MNIETEFPSKTLATKANSTSKLSPWPSNIYPLEVNMYNFNMLKSVNASYNLDTKKNKDHTVVSNKYRNQLNKIQYSFKVNFITNWIQKKCFSA